MTTDQNKSRRENLQEFAAQNPNDSFSHYALALEFLKEEDFVSADKHFRHIIQATPDYVPVYLMYAQMLVKQHRAVEAKSVLTAGIEIATRAKNAHARSEMEGLLAEIS
jgi:predicted Zn-dependent protease